MSNFYSERAVTREISPRAEIIHSTRGEISPEVWFHLGLEERSVNGFPHGNNIAVESNVVIHLFVILERNTVMHTLWECRIYSNKRPWYDVYFKLRGIIHIRFLNFVIFNFQITINIIKYAALNIPELQNYFYFLMVSMILPLGHLNLIAAKLWSNL